MIDDGYRRRVLDDERFLHGRLIVAGALGAIALLLMKFFNIGNPNL